MKIFRPANLLPRTRLIQAALDLMQPDGSGYHPSLMGVGHGLRKAALSKAHALELALARADELHIPEKRLIEIEKAFDKVYDFQADGRVYEGHGFARRSVDVTQIEGICRIGPTAQQLSDLSPGDRSIQTWPLLRTLFPQRRTLLCMAKDEAMPFVVLRDEELHPDRLQFIVPNPMSARSGYTQGGKLSVRCLENTGPRRFLVTEFDITYYDRSGNIRTQWYDTLDRMAAIGRTALDMCASILGELIMSQEAAGLRLALVVYSGGKSLHGWFYCEGKSDERLRPFFTLAVQSGACPSTWNRSQFVRMPGGLRIIGSEAQLKRQAILYFDPQFENIDE